MCKAIQYSDQMQCGQCGLAWDVNDDDPPACRKGKNRAGIEQARRFLGMAPKEKPRKNEANFAHPQN